MSEAPPSTEHFDAVVTDRIVEEPWVVSKVRPGETVLDFGSATSRYLLDLPAGCRVYAIDIRPTPRRDGIAAVRGDIMRAPFRPGAFDVIACVSTIEHVGLDVYGQGADEFGDEVAMRHLRRLLRPGGRLLVTAPFGKRTVSAWLRVYNAASLRRLASGYRALSTEYYRREGEAFVRSDAGDLAGAAFDFEGMRSGGVVLAELTPAGGGGFALSRLALRLRRTWRAIARRGPFWRDPWSGEPARAWLERRHTLSREDEVDAGGDGRGRGA